VNGRQDAWFCSGRTLVARHARMHCACSFSHWHLVLPHAPLQRTLQGIHSDWAFLAQRVTDRASGGMDDAATTPTI